MSWGSFWGGIEMRRIDPATGPYLHREGRSKLLMRAINWDAHGWPTVEVDGAGS
jgi:hypothetical protein